MLSGSVITVYFNIIVCQVTAVGFCASVAVTEGNDDFNFCFNDSEEFTELYFRLRYNNDINIAIQSGEEVIASLQMLPYPMTFEGEDIHTAYISGACTHPDYRNRGVMHELLSQAFARMLHDNVACRPLTKNINCHEK